MGLFSLEADSGNALAMVDLGRMWADGLGVEADPDTAQEWYRKALAAFLSAERELPERKKTYLQYRIGKMYLTGLGCTQDYKTAADWLERAAGKRHKYRKSRILFQISCLGVPLVGGGLFSFFDRLLVRQIGSY